MSKSRNKNKDKKRMHNKATLTGLNCRPFDYKSNNTLPLFCAILRKIDGVFNNDTDYDLILDYDNNK